MHSEGFCFESSISKRSCFLIVITVLSYIIILNVPIDTHACESAM